MLNYFSARFNPHSFILSRRHDAAGARDTTSHRYDTATHDTTDTRRRRRRRPTATTQQHTTPQARDDDAPPLRRRNMTPWARYVKTISRQTTPRCRKTTPFTLAESPSSRCRASHCYESYLEYLVTCRIAQYIYLAHSTTKVLTSALCCVYMKA
jgi:hypothetical protein